MTHTVGESDTPGQQTPISNRPAPSRAPSPPTARAIAVIELLAHSAPDTLTLAQIVRLTGQSRATSHAVLSEMANHGWVTRHPSTGAFGLGPAFVSLTHQAQRTDLLGAWGALVVDELAEQTGVACFLARRLTEDMITVSDHAVPSDASSPDPQPTDDADDSGRWFRPGGRVRLRPPICREFLAWSSQADRDTWIGQAPPATRTRLTLVLDEIRARGYSVERMSTDHLAMIDALGSLDAVPDALRSRVGDLLNELTVIDYLGSELVGEVGVVTVGAPVFDAHGTVIASVVSCPSRMVDVDDLHELADATVAAAQSTSARLRAAE